METSWNKEATRFARRQVQKLLVRYEGDPETFFDEVNAEWKTYVASMKARMDALPADVLGPARLGLAMRQVAADEAEETATKQAQEARAGVVQAQEDAAVAAEVAKQVAERASADAKKKAAEKAAADEEKLAATAVAAAKKKRAEAAAIAEEKTRAEAVVAAEEKKKKAEVLAAAAATARHAAAASQAAKTVPKK